MKGLLNFWLAALFVEGDCLIFRFCLFNVARSAVARAALQWRCLLRTGGRSIHLAGLLHGTFDTQSLHIFIGRDFRIDMVSLQHQCERQTNYKKSHRHNRNSNYNQPTRHFFSFFTRYKFGLSAANLYICRLKCKNVALSGEGKSQAGRFRRYACLRNPHIRRVCCGFGACASLEIPSAIDFRGGVRAFVDRSRRQKHFVQRTSKAKTYENCHCRCRRDG